MLFNCLCFDIILRFLGISWWFYYTNKTIDIIYALSLVKYFKFDNY